MNSLLLGFEIGIGIALIVLIISGVGATIRLIKYFRHGKTNN